MFINERKVRWEIIITLTQLLGRITEHKTGHSFLNKGSEVLFTRKRFYCVIKLRYIVIFFENFIFGS